MNILIPKAIAFGAATSIPETDIARGEVAWVSSGSYAVNDRRVHAGVLYECVQAHTGATDKQPDTAVAFWRPKGPSNRMAPFDKYLFTKARRAHELTYEVEGSFIDGVAVYGIEGDEISLRVLSGITGQDLIDPINTGLWEQAYGEFEYLFGELVRGTRYTLKNLPIHPSVRVLVTVRRNDPDVEAAVGHISIGNWKRFLAPLSEYKSGIRYGVKSKTKDYSIVEAHKDGTYDEIAGHKARDITLTCQIAAKDAAWADSILEQISGKAVAVEASDLPRYRHLSTVCQISGVVTVEDWEIATVDLELKGNV